MTIEPLLQAFLAYGDAPALIWRGQATSYEQLRQGILHWQSELKVESGEVVGLYADYSPRTFALFFALLGRGVTVAPVTDAFAAQKDDFFTTAEARLEIQVDADDDVHFVEHRRRIEHPLLLELEQRGRGGIILFSSGSTGRHKAVLHDAGLLLAKYQTPRRPTRTLPFMLFDHIGGVHTSLNILSSGGTLVLPPDRRPETILALVQDQLVEVLPATPTFISLMLLRDVATYDLSSLRYITYSAERMSAVVLDRLRKLLPDVKVLQNYGLSEVGILRSRSESSDSLWVRLDGDGFETRVRDGLLEIKSETAMLGYLNEPSPFTEDGWVKTYDRVETKGEFFKVLGRCTDLIIVGGEKVYPAEVEDLLRTMDGVTDVMVEGKAHALTGFVVAATVQLSTGETRREFRQRMIGHLKDKLPNYKIPQKLSISDGPLHGPRMKKKRSHG